MTKYTTIAGDMWDGIAYKTLGDEAYTDKLMKQNPVPPRQPRVRASMPKVAGETLTPSS